jgi:hypothetical protein
MPQVRMGWQRPRVEWTKAIRAWVVQIPLITFVVLKLTGVITWSWWWVLSPIWIGGILLVLGICTLLIGLRWHLRKQARLWMDPARSEWLREFLAGRADPDTFPRNPGPQGGEGQAPSPSDG